MSGTIVIPAWRAMAVLRLKFLARAETELGCGRGSGENTPDPGWDRPVV